MSGPIHIKPNSVPVLRPIYPLLHAVSFLFFLAGAFFWFMAIRKSFASDPDSIAIPMAAYFILAALSLIFSCVAMMARTGARWGHVSYFMFYLPVCSIMIPIAGTAVCAYCLKKVSQAVLPELILGGHRKRRSSLRPPSKNPSVYHAVPLHKSSASGIAMLSFIILSHVFILVRSIVGLIKA